MENKNSAPVGSAARLRRSLTLWDLVLYGVIVVQPVAPMSVFGVLNERSHGFAVTTILTAMLAMLFTAISYGRMARVYPSAGSAFTYVGQEINPALGYITGWGMVMDYLLNPMICIIWCSQQAHVFAPHVAYWAWAICFAAIFTGLNIQGIKSSAHVNFGLAVAMGVVIAIFFVVAAHYVFGHPHDGADFFLRPFYDPNTWDTKAVLGGTSIAVLTYIGFDGISTMSEEVENPQRNILLATVLTCLLIGILSAIEAYVAQLVWPAHLPFAPAMVDTAYVHIARRVGGQFLFQLLNATLLVANMGSGIAAQFGAARLLYGMGREDALPRRFFGSVSAKTGVPRNNVLLLGALTLLGTFLLTFEKGAELLNFGAFIAFIGVNAAALIHYKFRSREKVLFPAAVPLCGLLVCTFIWLNLNLSAKLLGAAWLAVGLLLYYGMHRRTPGVAAAITE
jgi:putrescine importer